MLRIGSIRWKGKCARHPAYNPEEGEGAIRAGCPRCYALLELSRQHVKLVRMMREFGPTQERPARTLPKTSAAAQSSLFDTVT